ncbi:cytochrome P450 2C31-like [Struthio camelus]|uniref:cytochrome P450 2C31-like n=1 Tax=Struthio camelus TaxID=8801 RepID=UPI003603FA3E
MQGCSSAPRGGGGSARAPGSAGPAAPSSPSPWAPAAPGGSGGARRGVQRPPRLPSRAAAGTVRPAAAGTLGSPFPGVGSGIWGGGAAGRLGPGTRFTKDTLSKTTVNLFLGTETVSSTIKYGLCVLLWLPEVEARLRQIDQVISPHREPRVEDRSRVPYTDAVIHEIQRFADVGPVGVPHVATQDVQLRHPRGTAVGGRAASPGHRRVQHPRGVVGTNVVPLLCTSQFSTSQFANAQAFDSGHFLDETRRFKRNEAFRPFSAGEGAGSATVAAAPAGAPLTAVALAGKRVCLGEGLAATELFVFLTSVLQRFKLKAEGGGPGRHRHQPRVQRAGQHPPAPPARSAPR